MTFPAKLYAMPFILPAVRSDLTFRPFERRDIPSLLRMTRENMTQVILSAWGVDWRDETLLETLLDISVMTEVVERQGEVVGYYSLDQRGDYLFIISIQVQEEDQGKGIGRAMMERIEDMAIRSGLEGIELVVQSTNPWAKAIYEHLAYVYVSKERNNLVFRKAFQVG